MNDIEQAFLVWRKDKLYVSSSRNMLDHPSVDLFLDDPENALRFLLDRLQEEYFVGIPLVLTKITGVKIDPQISGMMNLIRSFWLDWGRSNYPPPPFSFDGIES